MIENNKRIIKNTAFLYFRMLLTLGVTLYTSRVVFNALGVEDFGIYNVVAGVVTMFAFIKGAMSSATQRFFSFELGRNELIKLHNTFKMSINIHIIISIVLILVCETLGVWFLNNKLTINPDRLDAANFVFQCAVAGLVLTVMDVPYNANIVAHERMQAFAYISLLDVGLKLAVVSMLSFNLGDDLEVYALFTLLANVVVWLCYFTYNRINFSNTKFGFYWNGGLFKTLIGYTGWNLFGNLAAVGANQGINILLNIFFGPSVNAARALAYQINSAVSGFVTNLQMAINPQIIKNYSIGSYQEMNTLVFKGTKYSFFLLYIIALPFFIKTSEIIELWLGSVPEYASIFCKLALIDALIISLSGGLMAALQATGKIKHYQLVVGGILLLNLPLSFVVLKFFPHPEVVFVISISLSLIALYSRLVFNLHLNGVKISSYMKSVILPCFFVVCFSLPLFFISLNISRNAFFDLIGTAFFSSIVSLVGVLFLGLDKSEKEFIRKKIANTIRR